ncbi:MAG TPA: ABC transporter substrate-binding protein [Symbiobacteriaceae bacterium]|nr:ABC transporter substrate-binding protein [Symbiobacteriaceae bacterium]
MKFGGVGRRVAALGLAVVLGAGALAGCGGSKGSGETAGGGKPAGEQKPIKVGAVFILSGNNAGYGIAQRAGVELARDEINKAGGVNGRPIEVIFEDSQGKTEEAVNAVRKLIDKDEVTAIIGPTLSGEMSSAGKVAQEAGVPILGVSTTAPGITDIGKYVFRNSLPESQVLPTTVARAKEKFGLKKVALAWAANDQISVAGYDIFKQELKKQNIELLDEASFNTGDREFGAQITKLLAKQPDALFVSSLYQEAALFMVQARKAGYKGPIVGGNGFNSPKLVEIAQDAAEGAVVGSPWFPAREDAKLKAFVAAFKSKTGNNPDQFAAQAYDGFYLVAEGLKAGGTNRDKVRDALAAIKDYAGVTGKFAFDANRNPVMQPYILEIKGGQYVELK